MDMTHAVDRTLVDHLDHGRVLIAGAGVAGRGVARMLAGLASTVTVADDNATARGALATETGCRPVDVATATGLLGETDLVVTSPGWRPDSALLVAASQAGVPVIGDIEAAWLADRAGLFGAPRTWLAVTGTNGKTTATGMLHSILVADGRTAEAVGNIGTPPGEALLSEPHTDVLAAEVSSFQLHWAPDFAPDAGCVLNLADDHLDWHGSFANYAADKARALTGAVAVLALDDPEVLARAARDGVVTGQRRGFTLSDPGSAAVPGLTTVTGVRDGRIVELDTASGDLTDLAAAGGLSPAGPAGVADATAAAALARAAGVAAGAVGSRSGVLPRRRTPGADRRRRRRGDLDRQLEGDQPARGLGRTARPRRCRLGRRRAAEGRRRDRSGRGGGADAARRGPAGRRPGDPG
jgi:UDP-N-acetylmuramoylalanine--D-glutamate ligase